MPSVNFNPFKPGEVPSKVGASRAAVTLRERAETHPDSTTHDWTAVHVLEAYARGDLVTKPAKKGPKP